MNDDVLPERAVAADVDAAHADAPTLGMSSVYRLFEAFITMREKNQREHRVFEQTLTRLRETLQGSFNDFAAQTQKAFQQLRQEVNGDKRLSMELLGELMDLGQELGHIVAARPAFAPSPPGGEGERAFPDTDAWKRWVEALEIENRKVQAALARRGIHRYDAVVGTPYNPALHERVGSRRLEGMDAHRIAEQIEPGFASQQPEFVLRRPKVIISE